jgi:signal transduction histidine kinase
MPRISLVNLWRTLRPVLAPVVLCALVLLILREPLAWWLSGEEKYDQEALKEWVREATISQTLPELVTNYIDLVQEVNRTDPKLREKISSRLDDKRDEVFEHLKALGNPTKIYGRQLPLFPLIYRVSIEFDDRLQLAPIAWDSKIPRQKGQYRSLVKVPVHEQAWVNLKYHLHAYTQLQNIERQEVTRRLWLAGLGLFFVVLALIWIYVAQRRERERQRQRARVEQERNAAERLRLEEEIRRREAEHRHEEAERQNLELKSQLFANIGIMAGSYAHNIKNLLVRPNDLLRRCLEEDQVNDEQAHMLREVRQTLGTVTERLQQILQTVRRDPSRSERVRIDLNALVQEMHRTWCELAREKWKLALELDLWSPEPGSLPAPLWIEGDLSHLQQALENLLFNARDATFEMRNHLRDEARSKGPLRQADGADTPADAERRHALIAAASWKGLVLLRTRKENDQAVLEVKDNGVGMSADVRRRCLETHFSTKRDNALFAGLSAGMGLGLSFVTVILEHHQAKLEIESEPLQGALFRVRLPLQGD